MSTRFVDYRILFNESGCKFGAVQFRWYQKGKPSLLVFLCGETGRNNKVLSDDVTELCSSILPCWCGS